MPEYELIAPASSFDCVVAAVQNGVTGVSVDYRKLLKSTSDFWSSLQRIAEHLKLCDIRFYVNFTGNFYDSELDAVSKAILKISECGADALILQDIGLIRVARMVSPKLPLFASSGLNIHSLDGIHLAGALGFSQVQLPITLTGSRIQTLLSDTTLKCSVQLHGTMCISHPGSCRFSETDGDRSTCGQICRQMFGWSPYEELYPLRIRDTSLSAYISELKDAGAESFWLDFETDRADLTALLTRAYSQALCGADVSSDIKEILFSFQGSAPTDGYFTGNLGGEMMTPPTHVNESRIKILAEQVADTLSIEEGANRAEIVVFCLIRAGEPVMLAAQDKYGHTCKTQGIVPVADFENASTSEELTVVLHNTAGTPYICTDAKLYLEPGLFVPHSALESLLSETLAGLTKLRKDIPEREHGVFKPGLRYLEHRDPPRITVYTMRSAQITPELAAGKPERVYLPLQEAAESPDKIRLLLYHDVIPAVAMPETVYDDEVDEVRHMLMTVREFGVTEALAGNIGHIALLHDLDFAVRGDFSMGFYNSQSLRELKRAGLKSAALPFRLSGAQIKEISKAIDTEMLVYGRVPLMLSEVCLIKNRFDRHNCENQNLLTNKLHDNFPVVRTYGCRNILLSPKKLFLADKRKEYSKLGLWSVRLNFTTENAWECVQVFERYMGTGKYQPNEFVRSISFSGQ